MERTTAAGASRSEALALLARHERAFRRTALRCSLCPEDAEDAYQRAIEILLTKAPRLDSGHLAGWMHVVTRHEALAVRRSRERLLGSSGAGRSGWPGGDDPLALLPSGQPGPAERAERRERFELAARSLAALKPQQRLAIVLQASGYSYAEIAAACDWTYTKVNRCLAEGRARLRELGAAET